jgi:outer membrane protein assembly factor BamB
MNKEQIVKTAAGTSLISGIFTFLAAMIMLLNYLQLQSTKPLESKTMEALVERMRNEPENELLKQEIRDLDLLARRAFFNSQWQIRTGRYLLLIGAIVFMVSLRYYFSVRSKIEKPGLVLINEHAERLLSQRWLLITGGMVFLLAFSASFAVTNHLEVYQAGPPDESISQGDSVSGEIEMIVVAESPAGKSPDTSGAPAESSPDVSSGVSEQPVLSGRQEKTTDDKIQEPVWQFPSIDQIRINHNSFRGPLGNGVSWHRNIPVDWDGASGRNIIWKTGLSKPGFNSPVLWQDRLFIAGADAQVRMVYCLDRRTGKVLWQQEASGIPGSPAAIPRVTDDTGLSAPSLTTDGRNVYAIFATGDIIAFTIDGIRLWAKNLGLPNNHYGHSSSLLVWSDRVLVQYDSNSGGRVLALNSMTGEVIWDTRRNANISWASPILAEIDGKYQMVLSADPIVAGYDLSDGKELWSVECMMGEVGPSPAFSGGLVYAANEYARLVAIKPGTNAAIIWENDEYLPEVASPVASDGFVFIATTYGVLACYDALTGEKYWEQETGQGFYSSPVIADNRLYALDIDGIMHIYKVSRTAELVGKPALGEPVTATPAFADGRIYIRGEKFLYCIGQN